MGMRIGLVFSCDFMFSRSVKHTEDRGGWGGEGVGCRGGGGVGEGGGSGRGVGTVVPWGGGEASGGGRGGGGEGG